jgi:hypothetical protein
MSSANLQKALKRHSTSDDGGNYKWGGNLQGIMGSTAHIGNDLHIKKETLDREYGEENFSDAMAALKLHQIGQEMVEGKIDKGVIVDYEGSAHLPAKYFYLRNPLYGLMTVLKSPHLGY